MVKVFAWREGRKVPPEAAVKTEQYFFMAILCLVMYLNGYRHMAAMSAGITSRGQWKTNAPTVTTIVILKGSNVSIKRMAMNVFVRKDILSVRIERVILSVHKDVSMANVYGQISVSAILGLWEPTAAFHVNVTAIRIVLDLTNCSNAKNVVIILKALSVVSV